MPEKLINLINSYGLWLQRRTLTSERRRFFISGVTKWALNAVVVVTIFAVAEDKLNPVVTSYLDVTRKASAGITWALAFLFSAPSILAMMNCLRKPKDQNALKKSRDLSFGSARILSTIVTLGLLGLISSMYFPVGETLLVTLLVCFSSLILFRKKIGSYYRWLEIQFHSGFQADLSKDSRSKTHERLAPWDAHLTEVRVPAGSSIVGRPLELLGLREKYGLNIVVVSRDGQDIVAPTAKDILYPGDKLLCFATDSEIERFRSDLALEQLAQTGGQQSEDYEIRRFRVRNESAMNNVSIRHSGIREHFDCIVVGIEREGKRLRSPESKMIITEGDLLWVVGDSSRLKELMLKFESQRR
jgi:CPA2 family monovalent cation:H+ antiporter-2